MKSKSRSGSSAGTIVRVLIIVILAVLIGGVLLFNFFFKTDGSPSSVFGVYFLRTKETSMIPEIKDGDMIIGLKTDPEDIAADDVIICQVVTRITVMRVAAVDNSVSPPAFSVKYDTVPISDAFLISSDNVIAKAYFKSAFLGKLLDVATSVPGIIVAVIIPLTLIIIYQITRFAKDREDRLEYLEDDYDGTEGIRRTEKKISERTADLTEMLSERKLDDPAISLTEFKPEKPQTEKKLSIDSRGRAEVKETKKLTAADAVTRQIAYNAYKRYQPPEEQKEQLYSGVAPRSMTEGYSAANNPVIFIEPQTPPNPTNPKQTKQAARQQTVNQTPQKTANAAPVTRIDDLVRNQNASQAAEEASARDMLTPKPASVIPESIAKVQETAAETGKAGSAGFDDTVREYFRKTPPETPAKPETPEIDKILPSAPPPGAVLPKENIAPVRRKKTTRTVDELMKIIDAETDKLK
jgi:signal peptidase I